MCFKGKIKFVAMLVAMLCVCGNISAQGREYIRKAIEEWGECRNVALTMTNGDLAFYQQNGYAQYGCPADLDKAIKELNASDEFIEDVQLTESGKWFILYGNNNFRWNNIPSSLEEQLKEFNKEGEVVTTVTFNDADDWIVISTNYVAASDADVQKWLEDGQKQHGAIWATCITDEAVVAVYENGYQFLGNVPESLQKALEETEIDVYRLKITNDAWFFADLEGVYEYKM